MKKTIRIMGALLLQMALLPLLAQDIPVFPEAEGFGIYTEAGRGGEVIKVTNLNEAGPGSLKEAIENENPRIIVFEVGGVIELENQLWINHPHLTLAGQTAPDPGITLIGGGLVINTSDIFIQHIAIRPGDSKTHINHEFHDGIRIQNHAKNIVIDHCSFSWGVDENIDITPDHYNNGVTISNCISAEGLRFSIHPRGEHSCGMLIGQKNYNISVIRNIIANNVRRNPYIKGPAEVVLVNNLISNPGKHAIRIMPWLPQNDIKISVYGNKLQSGYNTMLEDNRFILQTLKIAPDSRAYFHGNVSDRLWTTGTEDLMPPVKVDSPEEALWLTPIKLYDADTLMDFLTVTAGMRPYKRDLVDKRIISDIYQNSGRIIDSQDEVGGYPQYQDTYKTIQIPDYPGNDDDNDGYTNIEEWLHKLSDSLIYGDGSVPEAPSELTANAISSNKIRLNWKDNSNNEAAFRVERFENNHFTIIGYTIGDVTTFLDENLNQTSKYRYRLTALNANGISDYSNEATDTTWVADPPAPPMGLQLNVLNDHEILLDWTDNQEADMKGYKVYRGQSLPLKLSEDYLIATTEQSSYSDNQLLPYTVYHYFVTACNALDEESLPSDTLTGKTLEYVDNDTTLVGYWKFESSSASSVIDSSFSNLDGTIAGSVDRVPGNIGNALYFNDDMDKVVFPVDSAHYLKNFTIAFWFKPVPALTSNLYHANILTGNGICLQTLNYRGHADERERVQVRFCYSAPIFSQLFAKIPVDANYTLDNGEFHHFALTVEENPGDDYLTARMFLNKQLVATGTMASRQTFDIDGFLLAEGGDLPFDGSIDELRIYNRTLSETEIKAIPGLTDPTNIRLQSFDPNQIDITWDEISDPNFYSYSVYRSIWPDFEPHDSLRMAVNLIKNTYSDTTVEAGHAYYYRVSVYDKREIETNISSAVPGTTSYVDSTYIVHYSFDHSSSSFVKDSSKNNLDGSINQSLEFDNGLFDKAIDFSGDNGYIEIPYDGLNFFGEISFSFYILLTNDQIQYVGQQGESVLFTKGSDIQCKIYSLENISTLLYFNDLKFKLADSSLFDSSFHHIAITVDTIANEEAIYSVYFDGDLLGEKESAVLGNIGPDQFMIGFNGNQNSRFSGMMDDLKIFHRVLSEDEIRTLSDELLVNNWYPNSSSNTDYVSIYPNPAKNYVVIDFDLKEDADVNLLLFDSQGKKIKSWLIENSRSTGDYQRVVDLSEFTNGLYFLQVASDFFRELKPIVIAK